MRSTLFLTLSLIVHAVCITALAISQFKNLEAPSGSPVEVIMGENSLPATGDNGNAAETATGEIKEVAATEDVKAEEIKVEEVKPAPAVAKKEEPKPAVAAKKKPVKKAEPKVATVLPPKEKVAETTEPLSPDIDEAVAIPEPVVEPVAQEQPISQEPIDKLDLRPIKETPPPGVMAATDEDVTEAVSEDVSAAAAVEAEAAAAEQTAAAGLGKGGTTKSTAVSYLTLKQFSGNPAPVYPLRARMEQRQGQVELLYRVTKEGRVADLQIAKSSGHADLDEAALKAVVKYRFVPGQEGWARHPVIFAIKGEATALPSRLRQGGNSASVE